VWNDRLFLFWLRILKQGPSTSQKPFSKDVDLVKLNTSAIATDPPKFTVQAVLCWSEYYNGKWQITKTSDVGHPTSIGQFGPLDFDRSKLSLTAYEGETVLRILIGGTGSSYFDFYNTHSLPVRSEDDTSVFAPRYFPATGLYISGSNNPLEIDYWLSTGPDSETNLTRDVLTIENLNTFHVVSPLHDLAKPWDAPFFYEDSRYVYFVDIKEQQVLIDDYVKYGVIRDPGFAKAREIPPLVLQVDPTFKVKPKTWGDGGPIGPDPGVVDPAPMERLVTEDAYIHQGIGTSAVVKYGDRQIGPSGAITNLQTRR
jgi:hypothetical protein